VELRYILLLLGLGVIAIAAATAYIKVRATRRTGHAHGHGSTADETPAPAPIAVEPSRHFGKRSLQVDDAPPVLNDPVELSTLDKEIEDLEQSANLELDLTISDRSHAAGRHGVLARVRMDEKIDYIVNLPIAASVARDRVLGIYKQNEYLLERPHHIFGEQTHSGEWASIEHDPSHMEYRNLALTVQMADMNGPVTESDLNTFSQLALKIADTFGSAVRFSMSFEEAMARGRELDEFCRMHDVIASLNIISRNESGFSGRVIDQAAHRVGMEFGSMNIYHLKNTDPGGCRNLFSLANLYQPGEFDLKDISDFSTDGLTLFMNVPRTANPPQAFEKMLDVAKSLCRMLGGELRDQQQRPLSEPGLEIIHAQIARLASDMRAQGIAPGGAAALRLF
jgi:cell division protein ZipA